MKRRIIWRIVLGLVILLALALCVTKVFIPLFDTSDEAKTYVPDIKRFAGTSETFTLESENLSFVLDPDTTNFTVTDKRTGKEWNSVASGIDSSSPTLSAEQKRLLSVLTVGILHLFYVGPYIQATDAELYEAVKADYEARLAAGTAA